jgi:raffinose/stachyose/melibiose transport system substrate-binding protein
LTQKFYSYAEPNFAGVSQEVIPSLFAKGKYAMLLDGTWDQPYIAQLVGGKFGVGYFPPPFSQNPKDNLSLAGDAEGELAVASNGPNTTAALAYLNFLSESANYKQFVSLDGLASAEPAVSTSAFFTSIAKYTTPFSEAWTEMFTANPKAGAAAASAFNYDAIKPMGSSSAKGAAEAAEKAWQAGQ